MLLWCWPCSGCSPEWGWWPRSAVARAHSVHNEVPLAAVNLLPTIETPARSPNHVHLLHRLRANRFDKVDRHPTGFW